MQTVDRVLDKALRGDRIGLEECITLLESDEIEKMGHVANELKKRRHPDPIVTFNIGRNINYTNVCDVYCRFCAFYRPPGSKEGYVLSDETILQKIQETVDVGGDEILMQGGVNPDLPFQYYLDLLRKIKQRFPQIIMHSFSPAEIQKMKQLSGLSLEEVLRQLHEAGLDSLPGGGGEILDDRTRKKISRLKGSWTDWMDVMKAAHKIGMNTTATMVYGFGESMEERALHMLRVRDAQDECKANGYSSKGFTAFIVWPFQPENTNLQREKSKPEEYLKMVAINRIMLDNIDNLQASWVTMGPEIGKLALSYGVNDFGSTMIEENVVSAAGTTHKVNIDLILRLIRETGNIPAQRNTRYEILRVFHENEKVDRDFVMQN
ncbi:MULTISPECIES: cyclic dehypoxanthinyl futalosine synthase [Brevibacillus]|jgi:cyclic dehypoxanthinyl futalosine synthase|uniref:Cyclic dehypoxanthine futalosine synthase n=1 Tax=Brevibacillus borstelensis AK1 TaxID=1300222 RepID=M8DIF3_9BACL|nr:cyclic dehypoxanthinyl futalosine synthase [Brevibacillus borstelensis]EMT53368.1 radical SAM protein [Brevibacillus borstelensis AK1]KKX53232.1 radical SAM protein [Brevibacillus borstelensis cifa_chp40]MBE5394226.1 dehypoxanthine futalosine cyclase [Brevibacillus borstelensis]MCC0564260.1 dehypoxanthine futalosine cyclase [Brevibacillus borstelensis]MCM3471575.1 dehypoxanthine futalosine cyclase [Brevibacillus borstelensis]